MNNGDEENTRPRIHNINEPRNRRRHNMSDKGIRWYGHLKIMEKNKHARKTTEWKPDNRSRGRPKIRWEDQVRNYLSKLDIQD